MEVSLETAECDRIMESKLPVVADADEINTGINKRNGIAFPVDL